ncbi:putative lysine-specific demethylase ELF6 [Bienertia sinuspersici]
MGNVEIPKWLKLLPLAPEFRPTDTEFADPIAYISKIEKEAATFGICKVIPPLAKPSKRYVFNNLNKSLSRTRELGLDVNLSEVGDSSRKEKPNGSRAVFTTRQQELGQTSKRSRGAVDLPQPPAQKQVWQSGELYTLDQFESKSKAFSRSMLGMVKEVTPKVIEALFWKAASEKPIYVEYANDVSKKKRRRIGRSYWRQQSVNDGNNICTGVEVEALVPSSLPNTELGMNCNDSLTSSSYKTSECNELEGTAGWKLSNSPWNLQVIARSTGSLTRFMLDDIPGVTSPMVYVGMLFSWFAWHVEDHELHSMNFLHTGSPKTWYAIPGQYAFAFEDVIRKQAYGGDVDHLGFNCGEAANFGTPQWLTIAKEAAVRRAAMDHLPMLSHQQLLYLLTMSFISRIPRTLLPGVRTSRLRNRLKEERELLVKKAFIEDMLKENHLLDTLLGKNPEIRAVLWHPDSLPSLSKDSISQAGTTPNAAPFRDDDQSIQPHKVANKDDDQSDLTSRRRPLNDLYLDANDLLCDFQVDSGTLVCVACGILGYPLMSVVQPSKKALMEIFDADYSSVIEAVSYYQKIKANAVAVAEELRTRFNYKESELDSASPEELKLIDIAIDEQVVDLQEDWTSKLGINLRFSVKTRKRFLNIKWCSRKSRTKRESNQRIFANSCDDDPSKKDVNIHVPGSTEIKGKVLLQYFRKRCRSKSKDSTGENFTSGCSMTCLTQVADPNGRKIDDGKEHDTSRTFCFKKAKAVSEELGSLPEKSFVHEVEAPEPNWELASNTISEMVAITEASVSASGNSNLLRVSGVSKESYMSDKDPDGQNCSISPGTDTLHMIGNLGDGESESQTCKHDCLSACTEATTTVEVGMPITKTICRDRSKRRKVELQTEAENNFVKSPCEGLRPRRNKQDSFCTLKSIEMAEGNSSIKKLKKFSGSLVNQVPDNKTSYGCNREGCQMRFRTKDELSLHKRNQCHHKECRKRFRSHKYVVLHQRVHDDNRPLKCTWVGCTMSFKWAWARTEHLRLHTGERPYCCKVKGCGLTFRFVSDFSRHRRKTGHYVHLPSK